MARDDDADETPDPEAHGHDWGTTGRHRIVNRQGETEEKCWCGEERWVKD
jgi:hypothetical protein